ncbi:MAG TPA: UDP-glucose/GDP-mannose dehydrogenase family protein [Actinomycetota bacterium]|nr:UDP-glucose/GDP-mannose dehydrogenase family protein [Actinomycetota bacterium]
MRIAIVGAGHVGLVSGACFAAVGHDVVALDVDRERVAMLEAGEAPFYEPGLAELLAASRASGRLRFTADPAQGLAGAELAFVCVATPNDARGHVDLSAVVAAARTVARHGEPEAVLVNRSTAPVGTARFLRSLVEEEREGEVLVAVNPEFLAEGSGVRDFLFPDRIVIGAWEPRAAERLHAAYAPIVAGDVPDGLPDGIAPTQRRAGPVPLVETNPPTAELIKYATNAFLAMKISFINEMAGIAEEVGGDVTEVSRAVGLDRRIGPRFLRAGIGWGGSCFPKDIEALQGMAATHGLEARLLKAANDVNADQHRWVIRKLQRHLKTLVGRRVAMLGLAFKPDTDDVRNAPALEIAHELARSSVRVRAYDPVVKAIPEELDGSIELVADPISAARGAEAVVLVTEWPEFRGLDLEALGAVMRERLLLDGRNYLDPEAVRAAGFTYVGVGR